MCVRARVCVRVYVRARVCTRVCILCIQYLSLPIATKVFAANISNGMSIDYGGI